MKYLVIGGVAGGATAAARLRRMDENADIILFERGKYVSYANCGLPYYIGGVIAERDKLFVQTVEGFTARFNIDIRPEQEVTAIHPKDKTVEVKNLEQDRHIPKVTTNWYYLPEPNRFAPASKASTVKRYLPYATFLIQIQSRIMWIRTNLATQWL